MPIEPDQGGVPPAAEKMPGWPVTAGEETAPNLGPPFWMVPICPDMSLRDYFAAHAPPEPMWFIDEWMRGARLAARYHNSESPKECFLVWRWHYADLMLAEREKKE
jgi:hypothetical protein